MEFSFVHLGSTLPDAEGELVEYIKGFVYDKNGHCLKSEIIQSIMLNWEGLGINIMQPPINGQPSRLAPYDGTWCQYTFAKRRLGDHSKAIIKLHEKMEELEKNDKYNGTGLSIETSKMTGRIIYKYNEPTTDNLIDM